MAFSTYLKANFCHKNGFYIRFVPIFKRSKQGICNPFVTLLTYRNVTLISNPFCNRMGIKMAAAMLREVSTTTA